MSLDRIRLARKRTIGTNQTTKALQQGAVREIFVARDADAHILQPVVRLAADRGVELHWVDSMRQLGKACGIEVGAAMAAVLED